MLLIDGKLYQWQQIPVIYFGNRKPLAYILNPKVASTLTLNFLFYVNHGYRYFDPTQIYRSPVALARLHGVELRPALVDLYSQMSPECFSIVRDPLKRFISAFLSKVFTQADPAYHDLRDELTSLFNVDLSPEADPAQSCLAFAQWIASHDDQEQIEMHFRPQHLNLGLGGRFAVDTILRIEDQDAMHAFYARWIGEEKAKWFLDFRMNEQKQYKAEDCMSDELEALVRQIFAKDYELFYPNA